MNLPAAGSLRHVTGGPNASADWSYRRFARRLLSCDHKL